jgi:hypothetical protein
MAKVIYKIVKHENGWAYNARGSMRRRTVSGTRSSIPDQTGRKPPSRTTNSAPAGAVAIGVVLSLNAG